MSERRRVGLEGAAPGPQQGGARGGDHLASARAGQELEVPEQLDHGRRRAGHVAVRTVNRSAAAGQGSTDQGLDPERVETQGHPTDVEDRVGGPDLVEVDPVDRDPVDRGLGLGQELEAAHGLVFGPGRQARGGDALEDLREVPVPVLGGDAKLGLGAAEMPAGGGLALEGPAGQAQRFELGLHPRQVDARIPAQVQNGAEQHVAREPPEGIQNSDPTPGWFTAFARGSALAFGPSRAVFRGVHRVRVYKIHRSATSRAGRERNGPALVIWRALRSDRTPAW